MPTEAARTRWLLLIHQLPTEPAYLRVKVGRRLSRVGALALKNSVYVLPHSEGSVEDFQWVRREILEGGGEATMVEAQLAEGLSDAEVEEKFRQAKDAEYEVLLSQARGVRLPSGRGKNKDSDLRTDALAELSRLERHAKEAAATDFFGAKGRGALDELLGELRAKVEPKASARAATPSGAPPGRTWVTRSGIQVDRIASAWLIRRFIDPEAKLKFVRSKGYAAHKGELRFDMFEAEYSHEGEHCTFETLLDRFALAEGALRSIAEIVHDIDLKERRFGRPETEGVAACLAGLCQVWEGDEERLEQGSALFDSLHAHFSGGRRS